VRCPILLHQQTRKLRQHGYAVIIFSPDESGSKDPVSFRAG
jgi:hypothetical protein